MTSEQPGPAPETTVVTVQQMDFQPVHVDEPGRAVYRALIEADAPGAPVYALTVTVKPPGGAEEAAELKRFLDEMEAGFFLTAPDQEGNEGDEEGPQPDLDLDLDNEILIQPQLVRLRHPHLDGIFGVTVVVKTAVAGEETPETLEYRRAIIEGQPVVADVYVRKTVLAGRDHTWYAIGGIRTGTATSRYGTGTIRQPSQTIRVGGGSRSAGGRTIKVHGITTCTYDFVGNFRGPY